MASDKTFVGQHDHYDESGHVNGCFVVFRIEDQWYWQEKWLRHQTKADPFGPYPTAEAAYLAAIGE